MSFLERPKCEGEYKAVEKGSRLGRKREEGWSWEEIWREEGSRNGWRESCVWSRREPRNEKMDQNGSKGEETGECTSLPSKPGRNPSSDALVDKSSLLLRPLRLKPLATARRPLGLPISELERLQRRQARQRLANVVQKVEIEVALVRVKAFEVLRDGREEVRIASVDRDVLEVDRDAEKGGGRLESARGKGEGRDGFGSRR